MIISEQATSLIETITRCYDLDIASFNYNPESGFLGETYVINNDYVLKVPKRGGMLENPQGNVKFSCYVMNEANLHGVAAALNILTKGGLPYAYDPQSLKYFHIMERIHFEPFPHRGELPDQELACALGFHAAQITMATTNLLKYQTFSRDDCKDHWSIQESLRKLYKIFRLHVGISKTEANGTLHAAARNLERFSHVPETLIEQIINHEPLEVIDLAENVLQTSRKLKVRSAIVHNDIKPQNLAFRRNASTGRIEISGSFDYTMACLGNPAKNIAYTLIDSGIGITADAKLDYDAILHVARGAICGFPLTEEEIRSVEFEMIAACLKKYSLRWEYWSSEIQGVHRNYSVNFVDPRDYYRYVLGLSKTYGNGTMTKVIQNLDKELIAAKRVFHKAHEFLHSPEYTKMRREEPIQLRNRLAQLMHELQAIMCR